MEKCDSNKTIEIMFTPDDNGINKFIEQKEYLEILSIVKILLTLTVK